MAFYLSEKIASKFCVLPDKDYFFYLIDFFDRHVIVKIFRGISPIDQVNQQLW